MHILRLFCWLAGVRALSVSPFCSLCFPRLVIISPVTVGRSTQCPSCYPLFFVALAASGCELNVSDFPVSLMVLCCPWVQASRFVSFDDPPTSHTDYYEDCDAAVFLAFISSSICSLFFPFRF